MSGFSKNSAALPISVALLLCCLPRIALRAEVVSFSGPATLTVAPSNILAAVSAQYAAISNLSCTVRREATDASGKTIEAMSRVDWARGDRMRVQGLKGNRRLVVIDGTSIHIKANDDSEPSAYLVENQTPTQFANLRSVPGSPEEMLAPLATFSAADTDAVPPFARTVSFAQGDDAAPAALVSFDSLGRVARIAFLTYGEDGKRTSSSSASFKSPQEVLPGVWLFRRVDVDSSIGELSLSAVSRFDRFVVNDEMPEALFDPTGDF